MAIVGRIGSIKLLKCNSPIISIQVCTFKSEAAAPKNYKKAFYAALGIAAGGIGALTYALDESVKAYDFKLHPPSYPWTQSTLLGAFDHASIRRGFEVYRNVCSACHSLQFVPFRRLIDVAYTSDEMKAIASEYMIRDARPNDEGEYFDRPGKITDYLPSPYQNDKAAEAANNGAVPPDLSLIVLASHGGEDYVFSLLNGYTDPPAGFEMPEEGHYNPYFEGSVVAMAPPLYDGAIEYSDGTPATKSQLAKDVVTFLSWCASPELEKRKVIGLKANIFFIPLLIFAIIVTRYKWAPLRARKIFYQELGKANKGL